MIQLSFFLIFGCQFHASIQTDPYIKDPGAYPMVANEPSAPGFFLNNIRGKWYGLAGPRVPFDENYCENNGHDRFLLKSENDLFVVNKWLGMKNI